VLAIARISSSDLARSISYSAPAEVWLATSGRCVAAHASSVVFGPQRLVSTTIPSSLARRTSRTPKCVSPASPRLGTAGPNEVSASEGLVGSMGTVGDALDNAMCESLIGTMKIEKLNRQAWRSLEDVRAAVFDWIETWYNRRRRHSSLGYLSPLEFESQHNDGHTITNP
jgi:hypothetical protein